MQQREGQTTDVDKTQTRRPQPHAPVEAAPRHWRGRARPSSGAPIAPEQPCTHTGARSPPHRGVQGGGVCPLALQNTGQAAASHTPPLPLGGQTSGCGSWQKARHLILPAAQAGRHKRRSQEGRKDRQRDRQTRKRPERWTDLLTGTVGGGSTATTQTTQDTLLWPRRALQNHVDETQRAECHRTRSW